MAITTTTLAVMTMVAAAASAAGSIAQGAAAKKQAKQQASIQEAQGRAQQQQAESQAEISRQQAERERQVAAQKEGDFRKQQRAAAAAVRAAAGARGIDISTGSPLLSAADFAGETAAQALRIREGGEVSATRLEQQADLLQHSGRSSRIISSAEASSTRSAGSAAFTAGLIGAGTSLLGGGLRTARILK
jgi:hypothetical protein